MTATVLDSSAVLAALLDEPRSRVLFDDPSFFRTALLSAVNAAEVYTKLLQKGVSPELAGEALLSLVPTVVPFTGIHAAAVGELVLQTHRFGLSLGDRACLALAKTTPDSVVYTTDTAWSWVDLGVEIRILR